MEKFLSYIADTQEFIHDYELGELFTLHHQLGQADANLSNKSNDLTLDDKDKMIIKLQKEVVRMNSIHVGNAIKADNNLQFKFNAVVANLKGGYVKANFNDIDTGDFQVYMKQDGTHEAVIMFDTAARCIYVLGAVTEDEQTTLDYLNHEFLRYDGIVVADEISQGEMNPFDNYMNTLRNL